VISEPAAGEVGSSVEGSGFFEQVGGAGHDSELVLAPQVGLRGAVEFDHGVVEAADDEQGGGAYLRKFGAGKVGPAAAGDNGRDIHCWVGGGVEGGSGAGAGAEVGQTARDIGHGGQFGGDVEQASGKQADVEDIAPVPLFLWGQQVKQQRA